VVVGSVGRAAYAGHPDPDAAAERSIEHKNRAAYQEAAKLLMDAGALDDRSRHGHAVGRTIRQPVVTVHRDMR
jgi:hypothetical protein